MPLALREDLHTERRLKRLLRDAVKLAERVDRATRVKMRTPSGAVAFGILVKMRRDAEILLALSRKELPNAPTVVRSMLEGTVNLRWILLRDKRRRANRYIRFSAVEHVRWLEQIPESAQSTEHVQHLKYARAERARVRHLFRRPVKKHGKPTGKFEWQRTWSNLDLFSMLREITAWQASGDTLNFTYMQFRLFSQHSHSTATSLFHIMEIDNRRGWRTSTPVYAQNVPLLGLACLYLISTLEAANEELQQPYGAEIARLQERNNEIASDAKR